MQSIFKPKGVIVGCKNNLRKLVLQFHLSFEWLQRKMIQVFVYDDDICFRLEMWKIS